MALALHTIKPARGSKKSKVRRGRGDASGSGSYSGRGMKGQRARSGGKGGLKLKGIKANIQNLPKLSGFKSFAPKVEVVNISSLNEAFKKGDIVSSKTLSEKGLISSPSVLVKVLGNGKLSKVLTVKVNRASGSAIEAITAAGGRVFLDPKFSGKKASKTEESIEKAEKADAAPVKKEAKKKETAKGDLKTATPKKKSSTKKK